MKRRFPCILYALVCGAAMFPGQALAMTGGQAQNLCQGARNGNAADLLKLRKAATRADRSAESWLGVYYGTEKHFSEAVYWTRKAALQGDGQSAFVMGGAYYYGNGVPVNDRKAVHWYRKAAALDYAGAGRMLARAEFRLGKACHAAGRGNQQEEAKAAYWYRRAALHGNAQAENRLGYAYFSGQGVPQSDEQAVYWYRKAAAQGNAGAENNLGVACETGRGLPRDYAQALRWYGRAARHGDTGAETNLGVVYYQGKGVAADEAAALRWWRKAAAAGDRRAQRYLRAVGGSR
ncbi:MAG: tetratricopeptide repeat protein [Acidithiobacillus sp.]|nr:tetratricopeptide repeat protein [Acidithiobacillus sp.]